MNTLRIGAWAGWLSLIGIFGYHLSLMLLAGTRVSGTLDRAAIEAFYANDTIAILGVEGFLVLVPIAIFALALFEVFRSAEPTRWLGSLGLIFVVVELPLIATQIAIQAGLVAAVDAGEPVVGLFRTWDALYNSGAYVCEAVWVVAFGLAMARVATFPRWMPRFSMAVAALLAINVFAIWVGIPDTATLPSALLLGVWFAGASIGLGRAATMPRMS